MINRFKFIILLLIGIFYLNGFLMYFLEKRVSSIIFDNRYYIHFLILAHLPTLYFDALTWIVLCKNRKLSLFWSYVIIWISQVSGKFFPTGNITGEFIRVYLMGKKRFINCRSNIYSFYRPYYCNILTLFNRCDKLYIFFIRPGGIFF